MTKTGKKIIAMAVNENASELKKLVETAIYDRSMKLLENETQIVATRFDTEALDSILSESERVKSLRREYALDKIKANLKDA